MVFLYSSDKNYVQLSMISIVSLLENNKDADEIRIYYINNDIGIENEDRLRILVSKFNRDIIFINASCIDTNFVAKTNFSISGYYRILITEKILEKKIIYLDCDTLILGSFKELWDMDLGNYLVAGVKDTVPNYIATSIGMLNNSTYINSGFLYLNLEKCRKIKFHDSVKRLFTLFNGRIPHHDQGVINAITNNEILYLSPRYNFQSQYFIFTTEQLKQIFKINNFYTEADIVAAKRNIVVIHFLNKFYGRPWEKKCTHPFLYKFDYYADKYNINIVKINRKKRFSIWMRKFMYKYTPFSIYVLIERVLDIKREMYFWKTYTNLKEINESLDH